MYGTDYSVSLWNHTSDGETAKPNQSKTATDLSPEDYIRVNYRNMMIFVDKIKADNYDPVDAKLAHSERVFDLNEAVRFGAEAQLSEVEVLKIIMESH